MVFRKSRINGFVQEHRENDALRFWKNKFVPEFARLSKNVSVISANKTFGIIWNLVFGRRAVFSGRKFPDLGRFWETLSGRIERLNRARKKHTGLQ